MWTNSTNKKAFQLNANRILADSMDLLMNMFKQMIGGGGGAVPVQWSSTWKILNIFGSTGFCTVRSKVNKFEHVRVWVGPLYSWAKGWDQRFGPVWGCFKVGVLCRGRQDWGPVWRGPPPVSRQRQIDTHDWKQPLRNPRQDFSLWQSPLLTYNHICRSLFPTKKWQ